MPDSSSTPSTRPPDDPVSDTRDEDARPPYDLRIEPPVAFQFEKFGIYNTDFVPLIARMLEDLEWHPKDYPRKSGPLSEARAYHIEYRGTTWRAIFLVADDFAEVALIAFGPHDTAYAQAERRI